MPFELPNDCDSLKVPELPDFQKSIVNAVMSGNAFQNPFAGALGGVGDMLSGAGGIGESISSLLAGGGLDGGVVEMLEGLQDSLGFNVDIGGPAGILGKISDFKGHMDMMSGAGSLSDFSERLGIGTALDGAKQALGLGEGGFGDMFSSFENADALLGGLGNQLGPLQNMLTEAVGGIGDFDFDFDVVGTLSEGISNFGDSITSQINLDNNAFEKAKSDLLKIGVAKMVTTDTNCYVNKLLTGMIGKPNVVSALPKALAEKVGPTLTETEKIAVEQSKKAKIEEVKAKGIKSEKAAELLGNSQIDKPEEIEKVKGRPVYKDLVEDENWISTLGNDYIKLGEPMWDEKAAVNYPVGAWIQWVGKLAIHEEVIDDATLNSGADSNIGKLNTVPHNEMLPMSSDTAEDLAFHLAKWPQGVGDVPYTVTVKPLAWSTTGGFANSWIWYALSPNTPISPNVFGFKWLHNENNLINNWKIFENNDPTKTKEKLKDWRETAGWRAGGYLLSRNIWGTGQIQLLNPNV